MTLRDEADRRRSERRARGVAHGRIALAATTGLLAGAGVMLARSVRERRHRDTGGQARELANLLALAQSIVAAPDLQTAMDLLLHAVGRAARSPWSAVYLVGPTGTELILSATRGTVDAAILPKSIPLTATLHVTTDHVLPGAKGAPHSILNVPLTCQGAPVGLVVTGRRLSERFRPDESSAVSRIAIHSSDALRRVIEIEELRSMASQDSLTGLDNKRRFLDNLAEEVARAKRYNQPLTLIMLDIGQFNAHNDAGGHLAGDARLIHLAGVMRSAIRSSDHPARLGGDEFAVICPMTGRDEAVTVASRVKAMMTDMGTESKESSITVSIGTATFPDDADTGESLFSAADTALYAAKRAGGDQIGSTELEPSLKLF